MFFSLAVHRSKTKKDTTALELDDILSEPITNSQKLAAFLQRKAAEAQKPKNDLVFGNFSFDLDFDVPVIRKPQSEAANETPASDVAHPPPNVASYENLPPQSGRNSPSPARRHPARRSGTGGHVPGSDKLRRHAIRRRSQSCGRRQLLQDFDDAANLTRSSSSPFPFVPEISSTPNCNDKILENQPQSRPLSQPQPQPQPASDPQPINRLASNAAFAAEIAEICEQRFALFENSMVQMDHKGDAPSPRPVSRPLTPSERHRTYTVEKRPIPAQLLPSPSSPNISLSKKPVVRVRRLDTLLSPGTTNSLHQCERVSAPVEECYVPETQPQQSQQLAEIVHNLSRNSSVVVIPLGGAFSPKPDAVRPLAQTHSPVVSQAGAAAARTVTVGTPESSSPTASAGTHKSLKSKTVSSHRTPQIVEDLDAILTDDESDEQPSGCALNLAPTGGNTTRQNRIRKRNNRQPSDDQESSIKLLNLHRSNKSSKSKSKGATAPRLNKAPSAPINGEQFAKELQRMSNYEILDLRKRNSLGRVYPLNGHRKHSAEQQEVLEQNIQWELIRRNLTTETETEPLPSSVSVQHEELDYREEATDMPPPAPLGFKDNSQRESRGQSKDRRERPSRSRRREAPMTAELINYMALAKTMEIRRKSSRNYCKRSLYTKGNSEVEDLDSVSPEKQLRLEERAEFDDQSDRITNGNGRRSKRSPEKNEAEEIHETVVSRMSKNRSRRLSRMANQKEDIVEPAGNTMDDDATTDQRSAYKEVLPINTVVSSMSEFTAVTDDQPSTSRAALEALTRRTNEPEPEPESEFEARAVVEKEAVVFKKPLARAPRAKSKSKRELNNLRDSVIYNEVEVDFNESSLRRSRRGQVPFKNTWCHTVSDPRQFAFVRNSMDVNEQKTFKPSLKKKSSVSRVTKTSLLNRPPLCSSTPRLPQEPLQAVIEDFEPQEPSESSSLGVAPLRWEDNDTNAVQTTKKREYKKNKKSQAVEVATEPESEAAASMPPPAPVPKKKGRKNKKQAPQLECDLDPVAPIPPTPSPSVSDNHQAASMQLMNWLRGYSSNQPTFSMEDSSGNRIGKSVSTVGELVFTNLDDIEYAFYDTKDKATVGYMRFQPSQKREKKRAKGFSLKFVVLFGQFGMDCSVPEVEEDDHCILNIGDMVEIEKGTRYSIQNLLDEVSVLMVIRN
ncbi:GL23027 [Drosophila persimilis]|uniref:GL23027 n=1 Tax=Drosophila persimilis TaxID=7234 RepID=B4G466_DROPE|nr:GL23027 [Drosophila persimilis]